MLHSPPHSQGNDNASATIEAARRLGIRIVLARCFYDWSGAPAVYRETIPQAVAHFEALARRYQDRERFLTTIQPAPHSQHGATPAMIEAGAGCARDAGVPWHIHLAEEQYQVDQSLERFGLRPLHAIAALPVGFREVIVMREIEDLSYKEIATRLGISTRTARNHITNIYAKLDIHDRAAAALSAVRLGLVEVD